MKQQTEKEVEPDTTELRIERLVADFNGLLSKIDLLTMAVLKAHFIIEEQIDLILEEAAHSSRHLNIDEAYFAQKVKWARAFAPMGDDPYWGLIKKFNILRNEVAHKPDGPERKKVLMKLKKAFDPFADGAGSVSKNPDWEDYNVVLAVCMESYGFLLKVRVELEK